MRPAALFPLTTITLLAAAAAAPAQNRAGPRPPDFVSPQVSADQKIAFRIHAPKAQAVLLTAGDIPGTGRGVPLKKADNDVWEAAVGPVPPGAYRYRFSVDGVAVIDPRNPSTSESNNNTWSLVYVPGSEVSDTKDVPHGAVARVTYYSQALKRFRRMHVYTPPGYEKGDGKYPVFYLLHGASDSDASWSTVGRAGFILDNLIAAGKARPMLVVMPAGHTGPFRFGAPRGRGGDRRTDEFGQDFVQDVRPYVEKNYRVLADQAHRAIAGLSMGGGQTLNIAFAHPDEYGYVGVFSSGVFGIAGGRGGAPPNRQWEERHQEALDNADLKKGLRLVWFGCGKADFLRPTSNATVAMLRQHHIDVVSKETAGGHTWLNWRLPPPVRPAAVRREINIRAGQRLRPFQPAPGPGGHHAPSRRFPLSARGRGGVRRGTAAADRSGYRLPRRPLGSGVHAHRADQRRPHRGAGRGARRPHLLLRHPLRQGPRHDPPLRPADAANHRPHRRQRQVQRPEVRRPGPPCRLPGRRRRRPARGPFRRQDRHLHDPR
jgi:enterochelin esterase family protein